MTDERFVELFTRRRPRRLRLPRLSRRDPPTPARPARRPSGFTCAAIIEEGTTTTPFARRPALSDTDGTRRRGHRGDSRARCARPAPQRSQPGRDPRRPRGARFRGPDGGGVRYRVPPDAPPEAHPYAVPRSPAATEHGRPTVRLSRHLVQVGGGSAPPLFRAPSRPDARHAPPRQRLLGGRHPRRPLASTRRWASPLSKGSSWERERATSTRR